VTRNLPTNFIPAKEDLNWEVNLSIKFDHFNNGINHINHFN
jgi:hypothetical protein